ncbi:MAG TPA: protein kinase [Ktedonobacteraceae bacterium]|nr:protein kinase [Ktedonobacteraceae bacterium]
MQTLSTDELVGKTIGTYHVERLLGRGRLSAVYLARHPVENTTVALTTILIPEHFSSETRDRFMARFTKEALALTALQHPHILPVYAYGEQYGYPYLVTPYMMHGSLADVLRQQDHCTPAYVQRILEQVAAGLEYAHKKGVIHGTLKPANVLLGSGQSMLVAGFGLMHIVQLRGLEQNDAPNAHLLSIAKTFLGAPEYLAPEIVQGQPIDARSDIYALGCILFELLSGKPPFAGASSFDIAMQHVQQPLPSLRKRRPDLPIALESVIYQALARNPTQRFEQVGELVEAFAQVCRGIAGTTELLAGGVAQSDRIGGPTVVPIQTQDNEFLDTIGEPPTGSWQLTPPIITGKLPVVHSLLNGPQAKDAGRTTDTWQLVPPIVTGHFAAVKPAEVSPTTPQSTKLTDVVPTLSQKDAAAERGSVIEPVTGASETSEGPSHSAKPGPSEFVPTSPGLVELAELPSPVQGEASSPLKTPSRVSRRRVVTAMLVTAGVAITGGLVVEGINLAHMVHPSSTPSPVQRGKATNPTPGGKQKQPSTGTPAPTSTKKPQATHTGTVVGSTALAINSSVSFNNPVDGKASLLIHLPTNSFVAYEQACTHQAVTVHYDPATHTLVCPAHGSIFDPANGGKVLQGPATRPLPAVTVRVNVDGTITAG